MASGRTAARQFQHSLKLNKFAISNRICSRRCLSDASTPPLNVPLPGILSAPTDLKRNDRLDLHGLKVTTLSNGIKIASEDSFGPFCTVGVLFDAGSRHEVDYPSGISHMLEKMAFQSTRTYQNQEALMKQWSNWGVMQTVNHSAYAHNLSGTLKILSETVWHPLLRTEELEEQRKSIAFELESLNYRPEPEPQLHDMIHAAAYRDNTLGLPKICPAENLVTIDAQTLTQFMKRYYKPERMTIAAVNANHDELIKLAEKYFVKEGPNWSTDLKDIKEPDESIAQYTGGFIRDHRSEPRAQPGPNPLPELAHVSIGFESASYNDADFFAFAVLNMLLGGGGSFSAGGPGKGMYSRLYLNVLNRHHWMYSATAFNHSYADSGIFCINASTHPTRVKDLAQVIIREFIHLTTGVLHEEEVSRAKKQLQSMLMMNLESRVIAFEDIGRQVLGLGYRKSPQELFDSIEAVTASDLKGIAEKMLLTRPSVAAIGNLAQLPKYDDIERAILRRGTLKSSGKFFFNKF
eukprot:gene15903-17503_t